MTNPKSRKTPRFALWLLSVFTTADDHDNVFGDFEEMHLSLVTHHSALRARIWLYVEIISSLPGFFKTSTYWSIFMLGNYVKIAFRNIKRHKGYTFINVTGLAIGLASCMLITLWVLNSLSIDKFYPEVDRIYRVLAGSSGSTPNVLGPALQSEIAEIQYATRVERTHSTLLESDTYSAYESCLAGDSTFFQVFGYQFLAGDPQTALLTPNSIVMAKDAADRYFPDQDAIGRVLTWNNVRQFTVTGIIDNVPENSQLQFDLVVSMENVASYHRERGNDYMAWGWWSARTYVKAAGAATAQQLNEALSNFEHGSEIEKDDLRAVNISDIPFQFTDIGTYIALFSSIAVIILAMACMNFVNLTTARAGKRAKETGMRKVVGAYRSSLIFQYFGESFVLTLSSLLAALGIMFFALSDMSPIAGLGISMDMLFTQELVWTMIGITVLTALLAGLYPALVLSGLRPVVALKNDMNSGRKGTLLRRALVVTQFFLSIVLITSSVIIYSQVNYLRSKDVGYNKEDVVNITLRGDSRASYEVLKRELLKDPSFLSVTGSAVGLPYWSWTTKAVSWDGMVEDLRNADDPRYITTYVAANLIGHGFLETFQVELIEGRDYSPEFPSDSTDSYIISRKMADLMAVDPIVGTNLTMWGKEGQVVGVFDDFHFRPLQNTIQPLVLVLSPDGVNLLSARFQSGSTSASIESMKNVWERINPDYPFE